MIVIFILSKISKILRFSHYYAVLVSVCDVQVTQVCICNHQSYFNESGCVQLVVACRLSWGFTCSDPAKSFHTLSDCTQRATGSWEMQKRWQTSAFIGCTEIICLVHKHKVRQQWIYCPLTSIINLLLNPHPLQITAASCTWRRVLRLSISVRSFWAPWWDPSKGRSACFSATSSQERLREGCRSWFATTIRTRPCSGLWKQTMTTSGEKDEPSYLSPLRSTRWGDVVCQLLPHSPDSSLRQEVWDCLSSFSFSLSSVGISWCFIPKV